MTTVYTTISEICRYDCEHLSNGVVGGLTPTLKLIFSTNQF